LSDTPLNIPFEHENLSICVASSSALIRTKIQQAVNGRVVACHEADNMTELTGLIREHRPEVVVVGFKFFMEETFPGAIEKMRPGLKPCIILAGSQTELDQDLPSKGVGALLAMPFLPEMVLLKINSVLNPRRSWRKETEQVLRQMRKYQRFTVEGVTVHFHAPIQEKTNVIDISYQGLKVKTKEMHEGDVGESFRMQINYEGSYQIMDGKLMWVREGTAGFRFTGTRPDSFQGFFKQVMAQAKLVD